MEFTNSRKGKLLFKMFVLPEELEHLFTTEDGNIIMKIFNDVRSRGDIINEPL